MRVGRWLWLLPLPSAALGCGPSKLIRGETIEWPSYYEAPLWNPPVPDLKPDPPPRNWSPRPISVSPPKKHPTRPTVVASFAFDLGDLPRPAARVPTTVRLRPDGLVEEQTGEASRRLAEIVVGKHTFYTMPVSSSPLTSLYPGARKGPEREAIRCSTATSYPATMMSLSTETWRDHAVDIGLFSGGFDAKRCEGTLASRSGVVARALIPSVLYAFVRCSYGCEGSPANREEELVLVAPASSWSTATDEPSRVRRLDGGSISFATLAYARGAHRSIDLQISRRELAYFVGLRGPPPAWSQNDNDMDEALGITVEVLWPDDEEAPQGQGFVSSVTPRGAWLLDLSPASDPAQMLRQGRAAR